MIHEEEAAERKIVAVDRMKLTVQKSDVLENWYLIERAEHDGREWMEKTEYGFALRCSARFSDADVEGTMAEMLAIAAAIESRGEAEFRRCAVKVNGDTAAFCSPRNSRHDGVVSYADALELAAEIRRVCVAPPLLGAAPSRLGEDISPLLDGGPDTVRRVS